MSSGSKIPIWIKIKNKFELQMSIGTKIPGWIKTKTKFDKLVDFLMKSIH